MVRRSALGGALPGEQRRRPCLLARRRVSSIQIGLVAAVWRAMCLAFIVANPRLRESLARTIEQM